MAVVDTWVDAGSPWLDLLRTVDTLAADQVASFRNSLPSDRRLIQHPAPAIGSIARLQSIKRGTKIRRSTISQCWIGSALAGLDLLMVSRQVKWNW